jgi:transposase-like protein
MAMMGETPRKTLPPEIAKLHYPLDVILLCVRWYVAYSLSLRNLGVVQNRPNLGDTDERRRPACRGGIS